jgi:hypothetical protein
MKLLRNKKGLDITSTIVKWILALLLLALLMMIIIKLKGKQYNLLDKLRSIVLLR